MGKVNESSLLHQKINELESLTLALREELNFYKDKLEKL
jgi:hypothetical protein